jgi:hypothetical protein
MEDNLSSDKKDDLNAVNSVNQEKNTNNENGDNLETFKETPNMPLDEPSSSQSTENMTAIQQEASVIQPPINDQGTPIQIQQPQNANNQQNNTTAKPTDPGQTLGILSLVFAFIFPLVGLVLGIIGHSKSKKAGFKNGLSIAGIVISIVSIIVTTLIFMAVVGLGFWAVNESKKICDQYGPGNHYVNGASYNCGTGSIEYNSDSINNSQLDEYSPQIQEQ